MLCVFRPDTDILPSSSCLAGERRLRAYFAMYDVGSSRVCVPPLFERMCDPENLDDCLHNIQLDDEEDIVSRIRNAYDVSPMMNLKLFVRTLVGSSTRGNTRTRLNDHMRLMFFAPEIREHWKPSAIRILYDGTSTDNSKKGVISVFDDFKVPDEIETLQAKKRHTSLIQLLSSSLTAYIGNGRDGTMTQEDTSEGIDLSVESIKKDIQRINRNSVRLVPMKWNHPVLLRNRLSYDIVNTVCLIALNGTGDMGDDIPRPTSMITKLVVAYVRSFEEKRDIVRIIMLLESDGDVKNMHLSTQKYLTIDLHVRNIVYVSKTSADASFKGDDWFSAAATRRTTTTNDTDLGLGEIRQEEFLDPFDPNCMMPRPEKEDYDFEIKEQWLRLLLFDLFDADYSLVIDSHITTADEVDDGVWCHTFREWAFLSGKFRSRGVDDAINNQVIDRELTRLLLYTCHNQGIVSRRFGVRRLYLDATAKEKQSVAKERRLKWWLRPLLQLRGPDWNAVGSNHSANKNVYEAIAGTENPEQQGITRTDVSTNTEAYLFFAVVENRGRDRNWKVFVNSAIANIVKNIDDKIITTNQECLDDYRRVSVCMHRMLSTELNG